ncbi:MAG TPA: radical SAM protein [Casimicrobiaceae bacterium]|nr:radical SAM protein [Casimicrobiaceae bacterium]
MRVGIISVFTDYHRRGRHHRGFLQPQVGALIAALLPPDVDCELVNDTWSDPDFSRDYDLLFLSCLHSEFDRARQISHYWRRSGAKTVLGGPMATLYPELCEPFFDAVVCGDPEGTVPVVHRDFSRNELKRRYRAPQTARHAPPTPRFDLMARQQVALQSMEITRGCPFSCRFCTLTATGTRFLTRDLDDVRRDLRAAARVAAPSLSPLKRAFAAFYDNNLGGNLAYLRAFCAAIEPFDLTWATCVTFNVIAQEELVATMARSGCRYLFVGLESFDQETLVSMEKRQNVVRKVRDAIERCHRHGILLASGLMLSPANDTRAYLESIPSRLDECGLIMPAYISFETPFPGTPHFHDMARDGLKLLPNALLQDFNAYTLVSEPRHMSANEFVAAYKRLHSEVYSLGRACRKVTSDVVSLLRGGSMFSPLAAAYESLFDRQPLPAHRAFITGQEPPYPEAHSVPLTDADFDSEPQRAAVMEPWRVSDARGEILPMWKSRGEAKVLPTGLKRSRRSGGVSVAVR